MSVLKQAERFTDLGLAVLPVPFHSKACQLPNWQHTHLSREQLPEYFNGEPSNIAVLCGSASSGNVVVDCDWPEAGAIARLYFDTVSWGRESDPDTHYLIQCPELTKSVKHTIKGAGKPSSRRTAVIEVLSDGHLCLLPGSTHDKGEAVIFSRKPGAAPVQQMSAVELEKTVARIAGAAVLLHHWPDFEGSRHDLVLYLTGACLHAGWDYNDTGKLLSAVCNAANDDFKDRRGAVIDTVKAFAEGKPVGGWPKAAEILGDIAPFVERAWALNRMPEITIGSKSAASAPSDWPELLPFDASTVEHLDFPIAALGTLTPYVEAIAHTQQCPIGLAAQCTLAAVSTAVQGLFDIALPHAKHPLSLSLLTLGKTGERKTSTDARVFAPHELWSQSVLQSMPITDEDSSGFRPHLIFEAGTIEGLRRLLSSVWPSVCLNNADAADFIGGHSMREGRDTGTAATLSKMWDGQVRAVMRGQDKQPITLHGRRVALSWMLQPQHIANLVNRDMASQGLLSRMLLAYPESRIGTRRYLTNSGDETTSIEAYNDRITELLQTPLDMDPMTGDLTLAPLYLDDAAKALFAQLHDHYEATLADGGINADIQEQANKAPQQLARIAGVLAAYEGATVIDSDHLERAKVLVDYYLNEWRDLPEKLGAANPEVRRQAKLYEWLRGYSPDKPFKLRDCCQFGPHACGRSAEKMKGLLNDLIRRGYVRTGPGNTYQLRPESDV